MDISPAQRPEGSWAVPLAELRSGDSLLQNTPKWLINNQIWWLCRHVYWPCGASDGQFWWKQESWGARLILQWGGKLWFYVFWIQSSLAPRRPFQTASSCWLWFALHGGMLTLLWIPGSRYTTETSCPGHRCASEMRTNNMSSDVFPIMLFALRYLM